MRNRKGTLLLAAVTVLAVAAAVLDYQRAENEQERRESEAKLVVLKTDQVAEVDLTLAEPTSIERAGKTVVTNRVALRKSPEGWQLFEPFEEAADSEEVRRFVEALSGEKATEVLGLGPEPDWAKYGLARPRAVIQLKDQAGQTVKIEVSSRKNYEGGSYLRKNDSNRVLVGGSAWNTWSDKKLIDFRDKRLLKKPGSAIESITVKTPEETLSFELKEARWFLTRHPEWKLDQVKVREILNAITGQSIQNYIKEGALTEQDRKTRGWSGPATEIEVKLREGETWAAKLGRNTKGDYVAEVREPAALVFMNSLDAEKLVGLRSRKIRDLGAPFEFKISDVQKLEINDNTRRLVAEKADKAWKLVDGKTEVGNLAEEIAGLLERLQGAKVREFLDQKPPSFKAAGTLKILGAEGKSLWELHWSSPSQLKLSAGEMKGVIAKSTVADGYFALDEASVEDLGWSQLWTPAAKEKSP